MTDVEGFGYETLKEISPLEENRILLILMAYKNEEFCQSLFVCFMSTRTLLIRVKVKMQSA